MNKMTADYWGLEIRQWMFCLEYVKHFNGTKAATDAGYSPNGAHVQASRLLSHVKCCSALDYLIAERTKRVMVDADWVLRRLADEAEADILDLYEYDGVTLKPVHQWPRIWRTGLVSGLKIEPKLTLSNGAVLAVTDIKLSDRLKRVELVGKHVGVQAFSDKVDLSSSDGTMTPKNFNEFYNTPESGS